MVQLLKLEIEGFGKFAKKRTIDFKKGINFITGLNETGKSTILEAILASLFKYTNTKVNQFFCWTNGDVCKLILTYKTDKGETFQIISDYKNAKKKLVKITKSGKSEISTVISTIHQYIKDHFGFDEQKAFENTTFIRQSQMAILGDSTTKNKLRDMIEEVFVGSAEASATKALKKIKKVAKDSGKEAEELVEELRELKSDFEKAQESKEGITKDTEKYIKTSKELLHNSEKLKKLKENKKLFDEKETLLKDKKNVNYKIDQIDEMIETFEGEDVKTTTPSKQSKTLPMILIAIGAGLCLTGIGSIIGIPLIIYGIYTLVKKPKVEQKLPSRIPEKISKYKKEKKNSINKKAVIEAKLDKYKLVNFSLDNFRDLEKLGEEVNKLKERHVELKTSISTTKQLVKSPEEIKEGIDAIENKIKELLEKSEEHELSSIFLEKSETEVQQKFTPSIEKDSKPILKKVTNNKYSDLKINKENLNITIKAPEINEFVPVDILSQGARDQIYFTIRTTMTDLLSGNINIPLIFDDPFHNFDDVRLEKTISAVKEISKNKQIILISHKKYQKDYKGFADNIIEVK